MRKGSIIESSEAQHPSSAPMLSPVQVAIELEKILASTGFSGSARLSRFLRFVVEKASRGKSEEIKEYSVGIDVFDRRPDTYNPALDPIVRVQARRLREKLTHYYLDEGKYDDIVVDLPVGSYVPKFRMRELRQRHPPVSDQRHEGPCSLAVLTFNPISMDPLIGTFSEGLTEEITFLLSRVSGAQVLARTWIKNAELQPNGVLRLVRNSGVTSVLEGSVRKSGVKLRITVRLIRGKDGYQLWAEQFDRHLTDTFRLQSCLSRAICKHIQRRLDQL